MICDNKKMIPYVELQYPVISLNRGKLLPPFIRALLLRSCSINEDVNVVIKKRDLINDPQVFYIMVNGEIHGECSVELGGLVTYKIEDGFDTQVDGMIKINLVHAVSDFLRLDKFGMRMTKRISRYIIAGIILVVVFILSVLFEVSGIVKGIILGLSFCCFMCAYFTFRRVRKTIINGKI